MGEKLRGSIGDVVVVKDTLKTKSAEYKNPIGCIQWIDGYFCQVLLENDLLWHGSLMSTFPIEFDRRQKEEALEN